MKMCDVKHAYLTSALDRGLHLVLCTFIFTVTKGVTSTHWIDCWVGYKTNLGQRETFLLCWELCLGCSVNDHWHHYFTVLRYAYTVGSDIDNICSSVNLMTRLQAGWSRSQGLILARGNRCFSSSHLPDQLMAPFGLHNWYWVVFPWIKAAWACSQSFGPYNAEAKNEWMCVSTPSYVFVRWFC